MKFVLEKKGTFGKDLSDLLLGSLHVEQRQEVFKIWKTIHQQLVEIVW